MYIKILVFFTIKNKIKIYYSIQQVKDIQNKIGPKWLSLYYKKTLKYFSTHYFVCIEWRKGE